MSNESSLVIHEFKHESFRLLCRRILGRFLIYAFRDPIAPESEVLSDGRKAVALSYRELTDGRIVPVILTKLGDFCWKKGSDPVRVYDSVDELRHYLEPLNANWENNFEKHFGGLMHSNLCNRPYDWESPAA